MLLIPPQLNFAENNLSFYFIEIGPNPCGAKVNECCKKESSQNIIGIMHPHAQYHKCHTERSQKKREFQVTMLRAKKVYPDTGYVTTKKQVFGEWCMMRVKGIFKKNIAQNDNARRRL